MVRRRKGSLQFAPDSSVPYSNLSATGCGLSGVFDADAASVHIAEA